MRFLRSTECIIGTADNHSRILENAIRHFRVSKSRWVLNSYDPVTCQSAISLNKRPCLC